jgi:peptide/nickel transport system substrate-binding protein
MISYPSNFANAGELMEAFATMFRAVGLNIKLMTVEPGQYAKWNNKPYPDPRPPFIIQSSHDNLAGDPVFSVFIKYGCDGASSGFCDAALDKEVQRVTALGGQERIAGWQEIFRTLYEDLVPDVTMYHLVGFTRVGKRIKFVPDVSTNNELRIESITFK